MDLVIGESKNFREKNLQNQKKEKITAESQQNQSFIKSSLSFNSLK